MAPPKTRIDAELRTIALPSIAAVAAIALLVADHFSRLPTSVVAAAAAALVVAIARMIVGLANGSRLLRAARADSLTDDLTGLGSRRRLLADLDRAVATAGEHGSERVLAIFDLHGFKAYNDSFGHLAGDLLLRRMSSALSAAVDGRARAYRLGGDEFCVLASTGVSQARSLLAAAAVALSVEGEGFEISCSCGVAVIPTEAATPSEALRLADRRLYGGHGQPRSLERQARDPSAGALRDRRPRLGPPREGVAALAAALGRRLDLDPEDIGAIERAAELRDIGKTAVPDEVLAKSGPLVAEEWELMRRHTLIGERMLSASAEASPVARLIRSSHERWDGAGYPDRLGGDRIPLGSRIIAICDAFVAMTEERPYRRAMTPSAALEELELNAGSQFDPELVRAFAEIVANSPRLGVAGPR